MRVPENVLRAYISSYCAIIPQGQLVDLFNRLGYGNLEVTSGNCYTLYEQLGAKFGVPFGKLAKEAMKTKKARKYFKKNTDQFAKRISLNKATGETSTTTSDYTSEEKAAMGLSYLELIMKYGSEIAATIVKGGTVDDIVITNDKSVVPVGTDKENPWTKWLLVGGIVLLIGVLIFVLMRKK